MSLWNEQQGETPEETERRTVSAELKEAARRREELRRIRDESVKLERDELRKLVEGMRTVERLKREVEQVSETAQKQQIARLQDSLMRIRQWSVEVVDLVRQAQQELRSGRPNAASQFLISVLTVDILPTEVAEDVGEIPPCEWDRDGSGDSGG